MFNKLMAAPLKIKNFRRLYAAQVISDFGNWIDFTALLVLIAYKWELGSTALAFFYISIGLPYVLIGPFVGVLVDRMNWRNVMIFSDLLRAVIVCSFIWTPNIYILLSLVFLRGVLNAFFNSSRQVTFRLIVPESLLLQANSLSQLSIYTSKVLGPAISGLLLLVMQPSGAFIINAITYIVSAILIYSLPLNLNNEQQSNKLKESKKQKNAKGQFFREFQEGLNFIFSIRILFVMIGFNAAAFFVIFLFNSLGPLLAKTVGLNETVFGFLISAVGLGSIVGSLLIGQWGKNVNHLLLICFAAMVTGSLIIVLSFGGFGILPNVPILWISIWFLIGIGVSSFSVTYGYILQSRTPSNYLGRVSSTGEAMINVSMVVAPLVGTVLTKFIGVGGVFLIAGILMILLGIVVVLSKSKILGLTQPLSQKSS
ncbi:MFS transporter [Psychrobacillus sp. FSL H8-0483]|uniref:MFS transporter n=1 Tax=Psychrobacillus sp. FSL H8-0483 TaxID=2921389 RepID=UPI003159BBB8